MSWPDIEAFLAVATEGQLSRAADAVGTSAPTLHRRLAALEAALGTRLFVRGNSGHRLTEAGERLVGSARKIEQGYAELRRAVATIRTMPEGRLRIAVPELITLHLLGPKTAELRRSAPSLAPEFVSSPSRASLLEREVDIAVRLADGGEPSLLARRVGTVRQEIYAPEDAAAVHNGLRTADGWLDVPWIGWSEEFAGLSAARCVANLLPIEAQCAAANSVSQQLVMARALGAAILLPVFVAEREAGLRRVQEAPSPALDEPVWLVTNREVHGLPAAKAAADWIISSLAELR